MNGKGGCCTARYGGDGGDTMSYGMSKVDKIMRKFRPIAPKPVAAGSGGSTTENSDSYVKCGRSKRKYIRVSKNKKKKDNSKTTTLSLLPEIPDRKDNSPVSGFSKRSRPVQITKCNCSNNIKPVPRPPPTPPRQPQVVSYVTVEYVTDTWVDLEGLGCTDKERMMNLEKDTCPGFISDGEDMVVWMNTAYRKMTGENMAVVLVRKDKWTPSPVTYPGFTCKVRVITSAAGQSNRPTSSSLTVPCDVWRMECGGCAWRLDVKAALSLGR